MVVQSVCDTFSFLFESHSHRQSHHTCGTPLKISSGTEAGCLFHSLTNLSTHCFLSCKYCLEVWRLTRHFWTCASKTTFGAHWQSCLYVEIKTYYILFKLYLCTAAKEPSPSGFAHLCATFELLLHYFHFFYHMACKALQCLTLKVLYCSPNGVHSPCGCRLASAKLQLSYVGAYSP